MKKIQSKLIKKRKITSGTKEWADHNVNCFKGCYNDCKYCYAKMMAKRFNRCTEKTWKKMEVRYNILNKNFRKYHGRVMFPSSHDIIDTPKVKSVCFIVLRKLLEAGNNVLITTKPRISVIRDILEQFELYKPQIQFRFTITSYNNKLLSFWEPNAPPFKERFNSLIYAFREGFKTSVSIEPFLDYEPQALVRILAPFVTESIWLGIMNYIPRSNIPKNDRPYYERIRKNYEITHLREIYRDLRDFPKIRFKDSIAIKLNIPLACSEPIMKKNKRGL
jgi:DNA repair photolyase